MTPEAETRIGTSGWHYQHWRGTFYEPKLPSSKMLAVYGEYFNAVEINNSFYKLPSEETFRFWKESTAKDFCFAVKASRYITHNKKLKYPENTLENFLPRAEQLGRKLGPILFQLPPRWRVNVERLEEFVSVLPKGQKRRYAFEFREPTWLDDRVYNVLHHHNAAFCIYDLAGFQTPEVVTANWVYVRLHGPGGKYQGSYSSEQLLQWANRIRNWQRELQAIYIYFDNDQAGYAAHNALQLKELLGQNTPLLRNTGDDRAA